MCCGAIGDAVHGLIRPNSDRPPLAAAPAAPHEHATQETEPITSLIQLEDCLGNVSRPDEHAAITNTAPLSDTIRRRPNPGNDVPLTVWPCAFTEPATTRPVAALTNQLTTDRFDLILAGRLVAEFCDHRDTVVDLTAPGPHDPSTAIAIPTAATVLHRRCVCLTDPAQIGDRWAALTRTLTDTQSARIHLYPPSTIEAAGPAGLIVARHPRPDAEHGADVLAITASALLAARGVLAVIVADPLPAHPFLDHASSVVAAATEHGLRYAQHVIALHAPIHHGRLVVGPDSGTAPPAGGQHRRVHTDVLIFR